MNICYKVCDACHLLVVDPIPQTHGTVKRSYEELINAAVNRQKEYKTRLFETIGRFRFKKLFHQSKIIGHCLLSKYIQPDAKYFPRKSNATHLTVLQWPVSEAICFCWLKSHKRTVQSEDPNQHHTNKNKRTWNYAKAHCRTYIL
jgi:hypothetical protein